ncbi:methyltransferase domain-containing protein [Infirmifilum lucidum]|uniref:Methyltransferase domain-containing protein n=1 Tax=Infirmifilum lucidum TaxID=2776706 RepID=A0A7L9FFD4_9CREN|nr:methyltransferase domain-containing protein [Infirmifilum lucidum]QOJ78490.1 methyltransferase domain-containing protein [Infirmifilum lucidum]
MGPSGLPLDLWLRVERTLGYLFNEAVYERANTAMSLGTHGALRRVVLGLVYGRVLDVGCGDGVYLTQLASRTEEVVCLDPLPARNHSALPNFHRVVAVAEYMPFRDKSFDFATAMFSFRDFMDKALGLFNMRRVSKRGVVILDLFSTSPYLRPAVTFYFGYIAPAMGFVASGGRRGRWELILPTLLLMPRADFFKRIGGVIIARRGLGLVSIVYLPVN